MKVFIQRMNNFFTMELNLDMTCLVYVFLCWGKSSKVTEGDGFTFQFSGK